MQTNWSRNLFEILKSCGGVWDSSSRLWRSHSDCPASLLHRVPRSCRDLAELRHRVRAREDRKHWEVQGSHSLHQEWFCKYKNLDEDLFFSFFNFYYFCFTNHFKVSYWGRVPAIFSETFSAMFWRWSQWKRNYSSKFTTKWWEDKIMLNTISFSLFSTTPRSK